MITEAQKLVDDYVRWIKDKTVLRDLKNEWVEISTPSLDRHNDALQIFLKKEGNGYILTDDGYILTDLDTSGCVLNSPKRKNLLQQTLAGFGVKQDGERLVIHATSENFPERKHYLLQAMMAVNDMFYLSETQVESLFIEDVVKWLDLCDIRYTSQVKFIGRTGFNHNFDFVIPKSRNQPERIIQALTNPKKESTEALMFKWLDTREIRPTADARLYAILNDTAKPVPKNVTEAFANYGMQAVPWTMRESVRAELVA